MIKVLGAGAAAALAVVALAGCGGGGSQSGAPAVTAVQTSTVVVTPSATSSTPDDAFVAWAQTAVVGDLLPKFAIEQPEALVEYAKGKCDAMSEQLDGSTMASILKAHTNGSNAQVEEMLVHMVEAYCPEKSKWLD